MSVPIVRRELRAHPGRHLLVAAAVVVAVAFCVGAFGFAQQVESLITPVAGAAQAQLPEGGVVVRTATGAVTAQTALDERLLARIRAVAGVAQADPGYDQPLAFVVPRGVQSDRPPVVRGVVFSALADARAWEVQAGRLPIGPNEVAVDAGGAAVADVGLGDRTRLKTPIGTVEVEVVGIVGPRGRSGAAASPPATAADPAIVALGSAHVLLDPDWAPFLLDAAGRADQITVVPRAGLDPATLADRVSRAVPAGVDVVASTSRQAQTAQAVASIDADVRSATLAYAGITILVAIVVVANISSVLVAQRTRELALWRLVGASRWQLAASVLGPAGMVGAVGAALGGLGGASVAYLSERIVRVAGVSVPFGLSWQMGAIAVAVAFSTSIVGALWPAWRAGRVPPIDALSDARGGADRRANPIVPVLLLVAGIGITWWQASSAASIGGARIAAIGVAVAIGFVGIAWLSRWVVVPLAAVVGWPLVRMGRVAGRLGVGNTARQPSRTAGAASTLMIGLALVAMVSTVGASTRSAISEQVGAAGRADLYAERNGVVRVSTAYARHVLDRFRGGIVAAVEVSDVDGTLIGPNGSTTTLSAADPAAARRVLDLGDVVGDPEGRSATGAGGVAMVSTSAAAALHLHVGSTATLRSLSGETRRVTVIATYTNASVLGPAVVPYDTARAVSADGTFQLAAIELRPTVPTQLAQSVLDRAMSTFSRVGVETPAAFAALSTTVNDTIERVVVVLLGGALGIGVLGLAATLALSVFERRRELVMLRAIGASPSQLRALVWLEASMIGLIAAMIGVGAGALAGRVGVALVPTTLGLAPAVPWVQLLVVVGGAVVVAWLVSLGVARRASRVPPAEAGRMI